MLLPHPNFKVTSYPILIYYPISQLAHATSHSQLLRSQVPSFSPSPSPRHLSLTYSNTMSQVPSIYTTLPFGYPTLLDTYEILLDAPKTPLNTSKIYPLETRRTLQNTQSIIHKRTLSHHVILTNGHTLTVRGYPPSLNKTSTVWERPKFTWESRDTALFYVHYLSLYLSNM